ncbi:MAG: TGS domain-containing protein [Candidatus Heimdallarchaeaceae archaeon]
MSNYTKLKWYRFNIARRIWNLEGELLIAELEEIIQDIRDKKLDKMGIFKLQIQELENMISQAKAKPKSTLMNAITNTDVKVGAYLHTTREALAGTLEYEDLKIQIIDLPGFLDFSEDWAISKQIVRVARTSDAILMVIDLSMDIDRQLNFLLKQLEDAKLIIEGQTSYKLGIIATKGDLPKSKEKYEELMSKTNLPVHPITIKSEETLENLKKMLFEQLDVIRVYTKKPGQKADLEQPFVIYEGSTVADVAKKIHTSFTNRFRFARVWGKSGEFEGQQVGLEHKLADKDILEIVVERR